MTKIHKKRSLQSNRGRIGFLMTLPANLILLGTFMYPIFWAFMISISDSGSVFRDRLDIIGFDNYIRLLNSPGFANAFTNTIRFVFTTVAVELLLGFIIALILDRRMPGYKGFNLIITLPLMVAPLVSGLQFRWLLADQHGAINNLLREFGITGPLWLVSPDWAFTSLVIANVLLAVPFCILVLLSALASLPESLNESGRIDGANFSQLFWYITLPQLKPAVLTILVVRIADAFRIFDIVFILTAGGPGTSTEMISLHIYRASFSFMRFGEGAAASFISMMTIGIVCFILFNRMNKVND